MWTISCLILGCLVSNTLAVSFCDVAPKHKDCKNPRATGWGYTEADGPPTWAANFPEYCAGIRQSPIDIDTATAVPTDPGAIMMTGWDTAMPGKISNNGHSLVFAFDEGEVAPTITGGRLGAETFKFLSLHWHWGSDSTQGSEHTKDGKMYPIEMHMVHTNTKYEGTTWIDKTDGLAVLGFFYHVSSGDNGRLAPLLGAVNKMRFLSKNKRRKGGRAAVWEHVVPTDIRLSQMVNEAGVGENYYYYSGSLTTPNCNEIVLWTNYETTIPISEDQLEIFRGLMDSAGNTFNNNYRPPQPLNPMNSVQNRQAGRTVSMRTPMTTCLANDKKDAITAALTAGTVGGVVLGAGAVLALSAIAPLFAPSRTSRTGGSAVAQRTKHLSQAEKILRAAQEMFGLQ